MRFYTRKQKDTESVTDFIAELKLLATECEFDAFLDRALHDIFAVGIADRETQRKLREVKQLTFAKAVEIAFMRESISGKLSGTSDKNTAGGMHALGHSSSGQGQQPRPAHSKQGRGGVRNGGSRRGQQQPEPSRVDMQVQAVRMSRMPQKGSSQINMPQQSRVLDAQTSGDEEDEEETLGIFHTSSEVLQ